jgi:hypothetical protein
LKSKRITGGHDLQIHGPPFAHEPVARLQKDLRRCGSVGVGEAGIGVAECFGAGTKLGVTLMMEIPAVFQR